jgi:hypothetical protein
VSCQGLEEDDAEKDLRELDGKAAGGELVDEMNAQESATDSTGDSFAV